MRLISSSIVALILTLGCGEADDGDGSGGNEGVETGGSGGDSDGSGASSAGGGDSSGGAQGGDSAGGSDPGVGGDSAGGSDVGSGGADGGAGGRGSGGAQGGSSTGGDGGSEQWPDWVVTCVSQKPQDCTTCLTEECVFCMYATKEDRDLYDVECNGDPLAVFQYCQQCTAHGCPSCAAPSEWE